eukprot:scaffold34881_cov41-Prasinocladus_malaysianus.AAC.2
MKATKLNACNSKQWRVAKSCESAELEFDSPARRDYDKYIQRLHELGASGKYETSTGGAAPNSRGHENDLDEGAFGFGALDTSNDRLGR